MGDNHLRGGCPQAASAATPARMNSPDFSSATEFDTATSTQARERPQSGRTPCRGSLPPFAVTRGQHCSPAVADLGLTEMHGECFCGGWPRPRSQHRPASSKLAFSLFFTSVFSATFDSTSRLPELAQVNVDIYSASRPCPPECFLYP